MNALIVDLVWADSKGIYQSHAVSEPLHVELVNRAPNFLFENLLSEMARKEQMLRNISYEYIFIRDSYKVCVWPIEANNNNKRVILEVSMEEPRLIATTDYQKIG